MMLLDFYAAWLYGGWGFELRLSFSCTARFFQTTTYNLSLNVDKDKFFVIPTEPRRIPIPHSLPRFNKYLALITMARLLSVLLATILYATADAFAPTSRTFVRSSSHQV